MVDHVELLEMLYIAHERVCFSFYETSREKKNFKYVSRFINNEWIDEYRLVSRSKFITIKVPLT